MRISLDVIKDGITRKRYDKLNLGSRTISGPKRNLVILTFCFDSVILRVSADSLKEIVRNAM